MGPLSLSHAGAVCRLTIEPTPAAFYLDSRRLGFNVDKFNDETHDRHVYRKQLSRAQVIEIFKNCLKSSQPQLSNQQATAVSERRFCDSGQVRHSHATRRVNRLEAIPEEKDDAASVDESKSAAHELSSIFSKAITGDRSSYFKLALAYLKGIGTKQNTKLAVHLFREAAELDDPLGQYYYAAYLQEEYKTKVIEQSYLSRLGDVIDYVEYGSSSGWCTLRENAKYLMDAAASAGLPAANRNIGESYLETACAEDCSNQTIERNREAIKRFGLTIARGREHLLSDLNMAIYHLVQAAKRGDAPARRSLKLLVLAGFIEEPMEKPMAQDSRKLEAEDKDPLEVYMKKLEKEGGEEEKDKSPGMLAILGRAAADLLTSKAKSAAAIQADIAGIRRSAASSQEGDRRCGEYYLQNHQIEDSLHLAIASFKQAEKNGDALAKRQLELLDLSGVPVS